MVNGISAGDPLYLHIRVVLSIILGLSITTLLRGMVSFIQHPNRTSWSAIHLGWSLWTFVSVTSVWWWQYKLTEVSLWTFPTYFFELIYCSSYYALSALLFPDDIQEYDGFEQYFISRRRWIFGLIGIITIIDIGDSLLKGQEHFYALGIKYDIRIVTMLIVSLVGGITSSRRIHACLVVGALAYQLWYTLAQYAMLSGG
jgi:hypothetical protein